MEKKVLQLQILVNNETEFTYIRSILNGYFKRLSGRIYYTHQQAFLTDFDGFVELDNKRYKFEYPTLTVSYNEFISAYRKIMNTSICEL